MIVADTSVWIDYVKGIDASHTNILDHELIYNRVVTGDIIITEFLQGFKNDREYLIAKQIMDNLEYRDFLGKEIAIQAAQVCFRVRVLILMPA
ncbi:hypothetical protein [Treponema vincentii]|uniref:hypothetical protein n=1 Tax=Treponema vincentii TaxID=69710 RepID=UPI0020A4E2A2|nr:hypothetical protein [Treponema vincentii]